MKICVSVILMLGLYFNCLSQIDPIDSRGVAIDGYDVVAYFTLGKAVQGDSKINASFNTITYYFSSVENQQLFVANPGQYLPQYEGYCALAVSYGKKVSINPEVFKIVNNKLYLFFHGDTGGRKINSLETWNRSEVRLLKKADELWPDVKKKKYKANETL